MNIENKFSLENKISRAVFTVNDNTLNGSRNVPVQSGWDLDSRAHVLPKGFVKTCLTLGTSKDSRFDVFMKRKVLRQTSGKIGYYHSFTLYFGEGFHFSLLDGEKDETAIDFSARYGCFTLNGNALSVKSEPGKYVISGVIDLDKKQVSIYINNINCGTYPINAEATGLARISLDKHTETALAPHSLHLWINHIYCKKYFNTEKADLDDGWDFTSDNAEFYEDSDINIVCKNDKTAVLSRKLDGRYKAAELEIKFLAEKAGGNLEISVTSDDKKTASVTDNGKALCSAERLLRNHHENVWQTLRLLIDTESGSAKVFLNGKDCGQIPCSDAGFIDGFSVSYSHPDGGCVKLGSFAVSELCDLPDDYVPAPVLPKKKDYIVGINTCSLWRNGNHMGWDVITPFEENKPYLGYYDEGIPEQSDWEIKWMSEHGIDFEFFCWFNTRDRSPIKRNAHSAALVDGYLNARYKKNLKFAIIWEAVGGSATSVTDFREKIVPYWIDYFFTDESYMTIDNKILIAIYGAGSLIRDFGSAKAVREQFAYVDAKAKELGFDGAMFVSCSRPTDTIKECGFDAVYAYNWNERGCCPDYTRTMITSQIDSGIMHVIPTVSTGFNGVAWGHPRAELLSLENMGKLFTWIKDDVLPQNDGEAWKKKFVMLSTWNEYGEGTFISPANLCGFGYLDEIRKAFTYDKAHIDLMPTEAQKARLCYIYPQDRSILRPLHLHKKAYPDEYVSEVDLKSITVSEGTTLRLENGLLCGESHELDPQLYIENLDISADLIKSIRLRMRGSTPNGYRDIAALYFKTENDTSWAESRGLRCDVNPDVISDSNFYTSGLDTWCGKITALRIDPVSTMGTFEIESISFMTDTKSPTLKICGDVCKTAFELQQKDGRIYLPFEQRKKYGALKLYSEWDKASGTLYLVYENCHMYFTAGKDSFTVNGEIIKLDAPLYLCDGLPMLDIAAICKACGLKYTQNGRFIEITE